MDYARRTAYSPFLADGGAGVIDGTPMFIIIVSSLIVLSIILLSVAIWQTLRKYTPGGGKESDPAIDEEDKEPEKESNEGGMHWLAVLAIITLPVAAVLGLGVLAQKSKRAARYIPRAFVHISNIRFRDKTLKGENEMEPIGE